jgi:hypothetical protein
MARVLFYFLEPVYVTARLRKTSAGALAALDGHNSRHYLHELYGKEVHADPPADNDGLDNDEAPGPEDGGDPVSQAPAAGPLIVTPLGRRVPLTQCLVEPSSSWTYIVVFSILRP